MGPPQPQMIDHSFTLQAVMELQKSVAELAAKTDRLIKDVGEQGTKISGIQSTIGFVRGAAWVIGLLVAAAWAAGLYVVPKLLGK